MTTPKQSPKHADDVAAMVKQEARILCAEIGIAPFDDYPEDASQPRLALADGYSKEVFREVSGAIIAPVAAMLTRQAERIKELEAERDEWFDCMAQNGETAIKLMDELEVAEKRVAELEAERDGYRDRAHYAEGTASLAIQHRDAAEKRNAELEAVLEPFSEHATERVVEAPEWNDRDTVSIVVSIGDLRAVRDILKEKHDE